jgi:hypothetical protein
VDRRASGEPAGSEVGSLLAALRRRRLHESVARTVIHNHEVLGRSAGVMPSTDLYAEVIDRHVELASDLAWLGSSSTTLTRQTTIPASESAAAIRRSRSKARSTMNTCRPARGDRPTRRGARPRHARARAAPGPRRVVGGPSRHNRAGSRRRRANPSGRLTKPCACRRDLRRRTCRRFRRRREVRPPDSTTASRSSPEGASARRNTSYRRSWRTCQGTGARRS